MTRWFFMRKPKREKPLLLMNERKAPNLLYILILSELQPRWGATSVSSTPTEWKLQLPDVQAPTCIGDFYSLPLLLPTTLKSFSVTKNLQTNSLSTLSKIKHSNPLCTIHSWPDHLDLSICVCFFPPLSFLFLKFYRAIYLP